MKMNRNAQQKDKQKEEKKIADRNGAKSNPNGPGGQGAGKKGGGQQTTSSSNPNGPGGQGDGKKGGGQKTTSSSNPNGQGDGKKGGGQQTTSSSYPKDMAGPGDGKIESGLELPSSSVADVSIVSFVEELLDVLRNLLENDIQDYSAIDLPSLASSTKFERALEDKLKTIHDKAMEMAELCININREADYTAQLLKTLSEFSQTYDKTSIEKMLCDPPKLFHHADEEHNKPKDPKYQGETEKNSPTTKIREPSDAIRRIICEMEKKKSSESELQKATIKVENLTQELENLRDQAQKLHYEVNTLRTRLSELAGAKLTNNNPAITDLSDPDRPTKLAEKYSSLYDNQWTDAFAQLAKSNPKASEKDLTGQLLNILIAFISNTTMNTKFGNLKNLCGAYIEECVRLCWLMQVQTPPVCIDQGTKEGQTFLKDTYREYTSSGTKITFVVWPALLLHANGPLLMKGVAQGK